MEQYHVYDELSTLAKGFWNEATSDDSLTATEKMEKLQIALDLAIEATKVGENDKERALAEKLTVCILCTPNESEEEEYYITNKRICHAVHHARKSVTYDREIGENALDLLEKIVEVLFLQLDIDEPEDEMLHLQNLHKAFFEPSPLDCKAAELVTARLGAQLGEDV